MSTPSPSSLQPQKGSSHSTIHHWTDILLHVSHRDFLYIAKNGKTPTPKKIRMNNDEKKESPILVVVVLITIHIKNNTRNGLCLSFFMYLFSLGL